MAKLDSFLNRQCRLFPGWWYHSLLKT